MVKFAKRLRLSLYIQHALRVLGVRIASSRNFTLKSLNPIAKCNILEGAFGLKKDELVGRSGRVSPQSVARKIDQLSLDFGRVDPEWTDFESGTGPLTHKTLDEVASYVEGSHHDEYMGITSDMFATGLWNPEMLPGADGGFMNTSTKPFWYELGRKYASRIRAGKFNVSDSIGLTKNKLIALAKNHQNLAARRDQDDVGGAEVSTYHKEYGDVNSGSLIVPYFDALDNPSNRRHNHAKEFWAQAIAPNLPKRLIQVFDAYRHLGATQKGGIAGGYQAAADWINERHPENPISTKGVKKAWENVKKQFAVKFEIAKNDPKWADLWMALADDAGITAEFSRDRGLQIVHEDRMASVANRHAYRQTLRQRANKKLG